MSGCDLSHSAFLLQSVFESKGFSEVSADTLSYLLQSDRLAMEEEDILDKVKEWANISSVSEQCSVCGRYVEGTHLESLYTMLHLVLYNVWSGNLQHSSTYLLNNHTVVPLWYVCMLCETYDHLPVLMLLYRMSV